MIPALKAFLFRAIGGAVAALFALSFAQPAVAGQAKLAWDANPSAAVVGYMVYYGPTKGNYTSKVDVGKVTQYTVSPLQEGSTYFFATTAYDAGRAESGFSNEVSASIPSTVPAASFSANVTSGAAPLAVAFTSSSTGAISTYAWNFGDSTTSSAQNPTHSYATPGTYTVSLTVTGPGGSNTQTRAGYIVVSTASARPTANFTANKTSGAPPLAVTFTDASTGSITNYAWNFGDSTTSTARSPSHTYATAGSFTVSLTVSGASGTNTLTKTNYITVSTTPAPVANFKATPVSGSAPLLVNFTSTSTGTISTHLWNFGDGSVGSGGTTAHTYAQPGSYNVSLTATGPGGNNAVTKSAFITVTGAAARPGLVAAYNFNAGSGSTLNDRSGNGNNGVITNGSWTPGGRFGNAMSFNGANAWVTINDSPSLDLSKGMTLEAWVYPTATGNVWRTVIMKEQPNNTVYYLDSSSDRGGPATGIWAAGTEQILSRSAPLPVNQWTHLAATYDGATQRLYVNGAQVASRAQTGAIQISGSPLRIGGNSTWGEYFRGSIDEVRIYNRALSAGEIQSDMTTPVGGAN
jgi:PKD repeat protein